jgi:predicted phosphodiesterase
LKQGNGGMDRFVNDYFLSSVQNYFFLGNQHADIDSVNYYRYPNLQADKLHRTQLPARPQNHCRIVVISDTHTRHDRLAPLPESDLFIHCGDIIMTGSRFSTRYQTKALQHFNTWLGTVPATKKLIIGGNHDALLEEIGKEKSQQILYNANYLVNDHFNLQNLRIWASPLSQGTSPNRAFQSEEFTKKTLAQAPSEVDILITHGDCDEVANQVKHKLHLYGHYHNAYGFSIGERQDTSEQIIPRICAPICDGRFRLTHIPFIIDFPLDHHQTNSLTSLESQPHFSSSPSLSSTAGNSLATKTCFATPRSTVAMIPPAADATTIPSQPISSFLSSLLDFTRWDRKKIVPHNNSMDSE